MINWIKTFPKENIQELVNLDGTRIGNDNVKLSVDNSKSASNSTNDPMYDPENGDQLKNAVVQQRQQGYRKNPFALLPLTTTPGGYGSAPTSYMSDTKKKTSKNSKKDVKKSLEETAKQKMEEYVEDIVGKNFSKDVLTKIRKDGEIRQNGIPNIDVIGEENPVLVRKVKNLIDIISKNQATGEQKGVILNYLINNIGIVDIPSEYKQEMLKKVR